MNAELQKATWIYERCIIFVGGRCLWTEERKIFFSFFSQLSSIVCMLLDKDLLETQDLCLFAMTVRIL